MLLACFAALAPPALALAGSCGETTHGGRGSCQQNHESLYTWYYLSKQ